MNKIFLLTALFFLSIGSKTSAQTTDSLRQKLDQIVSTKQAVVGVAISGSDGKDTLSLNGDRHFPLQSVFKFHIALVVLSQVDKGKFLLDQKIEIEKKDLLPGLYSPIRNKYPNGVTLTISEIIEYTVSQSDNVGCDMLLRLLGGPQVVEEYFRVNHFKDISIKLSEEAQQSHWDLQFKNWTTPKSANEVLISFYKNKNLLSKESYSFIWRVMRETGTGKSRLKGQLPENTTVAHKTGTSGVSKEGVMAAVNDIGIVFLPDGKHYFISVFVTDSKESAEVNEKIIADISKATWEHFTSATK